MKARASLHGLTAAIAGCALLAAAGGAGASYAWLGDAGRSTRNAAAAGTILLTGIDPAATAVLPAAVVRPGGPPASGIQAVGNGGTAGGALTVRVAQLTRLTSDDLAAVLELAVDECTAGAGATCGSPVARYAGRLRDATAPIALGTLGPGEQRRIRIRVSWPRAAASAALYDDQAGVRLSWSLRTAS